MDDANPQRGVPPPGRTQIRIGAGGFEIADAAWEHWIRQGHVPPDALVLSIRWTRGVWRKAGDLETYHLFAPARLAHPVSQAGLGGGTDPMQDAMPGRMGPPRRLPFFPADGIHRADLPRAIWGKGVSVTHVLFAVNLAVSICLAWIWGAGYTDRLWAFSAGLREHLLSGWAPVLLIPLFLHASPQHIAGNLLALAAGGTAVEEFYGRKRTLFLYLASGLCGAGFSLLRQKPVLSVGASGAIMGMYGVILMFLLRFRLRFSERQKFKTARIYFPLVALAVLPSIFHADLLSHVGGFLGGAILSLMVPPRPDLVPWTADPATCTDGANGR